MKARLSGNALILSEPVTLVDGREYFVDVHDGVGPREGTSTDIGSAAAFIDVMKSLPSISSEWVDELERSIEAGKQSADFRGVFDDLMDESSRRE